MERWGNCVAVVTGACSTAGTTICRELIQHNIIVVGLDTKMDQLEKLKATLPVAFQTRFHSIKCNFQNESDIMAAFVWIEKTLGGCDILINNTKVFHQGQLATMDTKWIREYIDLNIMATIICNREAIRIMKQRNVAGHLIMINDMDGHRIPMMTHTGISHNMYCPTKQCITAVNEILRQELEQMGTKIKVTNISPSLIEKDMLTEIHNKVEKQLMVLKPEDICQAVLYVLGTPKNLLVSDLMLRAMGDIL